MPMRPRGEEPQVRFDKRGYGWIEWGRRWPLGKGGTAEFYRRKEDVLRQWREAEFERPKPVARTSETVAGQVLAFLDAARRKYVGPDLKPTTEVSALSQALDPLSLRCKDRPLYALTSADVQALVDGWVIAGIARLTINQRLGRIKRWARWCVQRKTMPASVLADVESVSELQVGRTPAPEQNDVLPAVDDDVAKTLPYLPRRVAVMVQIQRLCGCRPGEICRMRAREIFRDEVRIAGRTYPIKNWAFIPEQHKTRRKGKVVVYFLNTRARKLLKPFLDRDPEDYLFKPADDDAEWRAKQKGRALRRKARRPCYSGSTYGRWVVRACEAAGVPEWHPNQLRHAFATEADRLAGIAAASAMLGHSSLSTTQIYLERRLKESDQLADRIG